MPKNTDIDLVNIVTPSPCGGEGWGEGARSCEGAIWQN